MRSFFRFSLHSPLHFRRGTSELQLDGVLHACTSLSAKPIAADLYVYFFRSFFKSTGHDPCGLLPRYDRGFGRGFMCGDSFRSGSGSSARAAPLFNADLCIRAGFCSQYETAIEWLAAPRQTSPLKSLFIGVQSHSGKQWKPNSG